MHVQKLYQVPTQDIANWVEWSFVSMGEDGVEKAAVMYFLKEKSIIMIQKIVIFFEQENVPLSMCL